MKHFYQSAFIVLFFCVFCGQISAQEMKKLEDFPTEVQSKIMQNKSSGKEIFDGVNFKYNVVILSNYKDNYPSAVELEKSVKQFVSFFSVEKYTYSISEKGELLFEFEIHNNLSFDEIKIKLTELKLFMQSISLSVSLK